MDETTVASINLRGFPTEMMVDEAGQIEVASGLENVGVGTHVLLEGGGEGVRPEAITNYHWTLETPPGSAARLDDPSSRTPILIPDVGGEYEAGLTISNDQGVTGQQGSLTIRAGTWEPSGSALSASGVGLIQLDGFGDPASSQADLISEAPSNAPTSS